MQGMWAGDPANARPDTHAAFRGRFQVDRSGDFELRLFGSMPVLVWLDGVPVMDGPVRFPPEHPEYLVHKVRLEKGEHEVLIRAHYEGITTRILLAMRAAIAFEIPGVEIRWQSAVLPGFASQMRRINPQLGWIEWADTRQEPEGWNDRHLVTLADPQPAKIASPKLIRHDLKAIASGPLAECFGYAKDDPSTRFFLRDLECKELPAGGVWRRYDLGRVRLGRPQFTFNLPAGTTVEFAGCEAMAHGRVQPWITLSDGQSCNLDHYIAKGGRQTFMPVVPKGMRFLEVHVLAPREHVRFLEESFLERTYYGEPEGHFESDDPLLNRIWKVGVETFRACTEDSLIDNPTRERGQWTGDVVTVGMDIASVAYSDLRPVRRALIQSAQCAREDGLISGLCPGGGAYLSTYAIQWISACMHFFEITGDRALLEQLFPAAEKNLAAFDAHMSSDGLTGDLGWAFVDWGHVPNDGPSDMALNLHYLLGLKDMLRWCKALGKPAIAYINRAKKCETIVRDWLAPRMSKPEELGLQRAVLALRAGLLPREQERKVVEFIKQHYLSCFPNDPHAPRLSDPGAAQPRLITPYFSHYALEELWKHGESTFVLDQYGKCWGWALGGGRTTWVEVFDTRWSHCHQWSGCPTWQLTRYVLGVRPRFDRGDMTFEVRPISHGLRRVSGTLPYPGGTLAVEYSREATYTRWTVHSKSPIRLKTPDGTHEVHGTYSFTQRLG